jgi:hypothetical protein
MNHATRNFPLTTASFCLWICASLVWIMVMLPMVVWGQPLEVHGKVLDHSGTPVAGATVWADQAHQVRKAVSDAEGIFRITDLKPGPLEVVVYKDGYALGGAMGIVQGPVEVSITLAVPASVRVRVRDPEGNLVPGATLRKMTVKDTFAVSVEDLVPFGFPDLRTDDSGMFVIPFVPEGGFAKAVFANSRYVDSAWEYLAPREKPYVVVMYPGRRLEGRVVYEDKGVAGAQVFIWSVTDQGLREGTDSVTDTEGFFATRLMPGEYKIVVKHAEYPPTEPLRVTVREEEVPPLAITLEKPRYVHGSVVLPDGRPAAYTRVDLSTSEMLLASVYSDAVGRFTVQAPSFPTVLRVHAPSGYATEQINAIPVNLGEAQEVTLSPIQLIPLPTIRGHVSTAEQKPSRAIITTLNYRPPIYALTDSEGKFEMRLSEMPDDRVLRLRVEDGIRFLRKEVDVDLHSPQTLQVVLEPFEPDLVQKPSSPGQDDLMPLVDQTAPELTCSRWFNVSTPPTWESLRGKVVVLIFWAGFDYTPVGVDRLEESRALQALYRDIDDVAIIGIHDCTSTVDEVEGYLAERGITFPVGLDEEPFVTFERYRIKDIPRVVLVDKQGRVQYVQTEGRLPELIKDLRRRG